ncbi:hypothetical protein EQ875_01617 [Photobacterium damselae subsp. damselae]|uniref:phage N-6-adenine-methyltransferase n=1 Tax=Photobacterium damselae TaxID=38293 RepID=UPI00109BD738|nr:phage N-6-adenine-methyltransferase [Photobacterium damselae]TGZ35336.1 hypothetical protein EQ875_01617 [Photobacterium damselae subsp. damselae]
MADHTSKTPLEDRDKWRTPEKLFQFFNSRYNFSVDVAASEQNNLCEFFYSEENSALDKNWEVPVGSYAWCNPPYSNISPWIIQASEQASLGIGCVMLVPADQSVGWFKTAIKSVSENIIIVGGRISFISATTGKPVNGNNKGSQVLIWTPFNESPIVTKYIERDLILRG